MLHGPCWLTLYITSRCTLKCNFCYLKRPKEIKFKDMSMETYLWILKKFKQAEGVCLTGGEAFLHKNVFNMIRFADKYFKMLVEIPTSGTEIDGLIKEIVNSPLYLLNISLDASDSFEYWKMRGGSKKVFYRVVENIGKLVREKNKFNKKLILRVSFICTKENYRKIPKKIELAEDLGVDVVLFDNLIPNGIPGFMEDKCLYEDDQDVIETINSIDKPKSKLKIYTPTLYKRNNFERKCRMPFINLTVNSNGDISTCCMVPPNKKYGNIFQNSNVWNNPTYQKMRKIMLDKSLFIPKFCKTCHGLGGNRICITSEGKTIYKETY